MARTSQNVILKKTEYFTDQESSTNTTDAFKACLKTDADMVFYKDIQETFFIRPSTRIKNLCTKDGSYAIQTGTVMLNALLKDEGDDNVYLSNNDSQPLSVCNSFDICESTGQKTSDKLPSVDQLSQFIHVSKKLSTVRESSTPCIRRQL